MILHRRWSEAGFFSLYEITSRFRFLQVVCSLARNILCLLCLKTGTAPYTSRHSDKLLNFSKTYGLSVCPVQSSHVAIVDSPAAMAPHTAARKFPHLAGDGLSITRAELKRSARQAYEVAHIIK